LLSFSFTSLARTASSGVMHYKRTSASQTPNTRNLLKPFDLNKYKKNPKLTVQSIAKKNQEIFKKLNNIESSSKTVTKTSQKIIVYNNLNSLNGSKTKKFEIKQVQKSETNSTTSQSIKQEINKRSDQGNIRHVRSPENYKISNNQNDYPRRWKVMKSVDLKATNNRIHYPKKERIRIIKSPPPNVSHFSIFVLINRLLNRLI